MKVLTKFLITIVTFCVLSVSAFAFAPQKNDNRQPPPPKEDKKIPKEEKQHPPPRNDNSNRDKGDKKGKP